MNTLTVRISPPPANNPIEQTGYRPRRLEDIGRLARARLADGRPRGATTDEELAALGNARTGRRVLGHAEDLLQAGGWNRLLLARLDEARGHTAEAQAGYEQARDAGRH